ncbi:conserved hypothetical protein [Gammaproteobacteria bacterium]
MSNCDEFIEITGYGMPLNARALSGKLPRSISVETVAKLICGDHGDFHMVHGALIALIEAVKFGALSGSKLITPAMTRPSSGQNSAVDVLLGHFTDPEYSVNVVRRYFASIGFEYEDNAPLIAWLRPGGEGDKETRECQQDKIDVQTLASQIWEDNPTMPITGPGGMVSQLGIRSHCNKYKGRDTIPGWLREVAPEGVKGKPGRPKKIPATSGK